MELNRFRHFIFGEWHSFGGEIPVEAAARFFSEDFLESLSREFMEVPIDEILLAVERAGRILCDPGGRYARTAMDLLPESIEYTPAMVAYGLDAFRKGTSRETLKRMLLQLGPDRHCLDHFVSTRGSGYRRAVPMGTVCHVAAGNIFLGSVGSLVQGIITKNVNILKASSQDFLFPSLFMEALNEADGDRVVAPYVCLTYWSRSNREVESIAKSLSDVILLFGGEDAVLQYKNGLGAKTETLAFGPKISFGVVARGLDDAQLAIAAKGFARDIVLWEQRACTSCQNIFLEEDDGNDRFADYLMEALEAEADRFPQPPLNMDKAVEIRKERELLKWREFQGEVKLLEGRKAHHTVLIQKNRDLADSMLHRMVVVNVVKDCSEILDGNMGHMKYYLSTVAVAADERRLQKIAEEFIRAGVMRIVAPGGMSGGREPESPHDGKLIIQSLVRMVGREVLPEDRFGIEYIEPKRKERHLLARINDLLLTAVQAPFYREFYKDVSLPLRNLEDFQSLPVLEKQHLFECSADENFRMATGDPRGCYVFASGGTTNRPKYLLYSREEFDESKRIFGEGFKAAGIDRNDVVVNYLKPGAFYTGFLAVNGALEETGCRILSMSCAQSEEQSLEYIRSFRPNVIIGFPSGLIRLAEASERAGAGVSFDKMFYAGEYISQPDMDYISGVFQAKSLRSFGYAAVETGPIGYQCPDCQGTEHHIAEDWCRVDVKDDHEILVTVFGRTLFPVIRYNVGDLVEWVEGPCRCGRTSPRIRLLDRSAKCIVLPASSISYQDVTNVTAAFPKLTSIYQAVIDEDDLKMNCITVRMETRRAEDARDPHLRETVDRAMRESIHAFRDHWAENRIARLNVELLPPGGILGAERTSKTRRIVDNRKP